VQDTLFTDVPPAMPILAGEDLRSYINVPLITQDELIGVLNLGKDNPGFFRQQQIDVAREVANQLAIGISLERELSERQQAEAEVRQLNATLEQRVQERKSAIRNCKSRT